MNYLGQMLGCSAISFMMVVSDLVFICCGMFAVGYIEDMREYYQDIDAEYVRTNNDNKLREKLIRFKEMHSHFDE